MTKDDLDIARARMLARVCEGNDLDDLDADAIGYYVEQARAIRLGDEARGLRVVPVELVDAIDFWFRQDQHRGAGPIRAKTGYQAALDNLRIVWLAASPFAVGDGE